MKLSKVFYILGTLALSSGAFAQSDDIKAFFKCDLGSENGLEKSWGTSLTEEDLAKPLSRGGGSGYVDSFYGEFRYDEVKRGFQMKMTNRKNSVSWIKCGIVKKFDDKLPPLSTSTYVHGDIIAMFNCDIGSENGLEKSWGSSLSADEIAKPISRGGGSGYGDKFDSEFRYDEITRGFEAKVTNHLNSVSWVNCAIDKN